MKRLRLFESSNHQDFNQNKKTVHRTVFLFWRRWRDLTPSLRCPKCGILAYARRISTAAPTPARCIRHRRRSQALPAVLAPLEFNRISTKKEKHHRMVALLFLCKDYKKDIFGRFAYDFELSQNILSFLI